MYATCTLHVVYMYVVVFVLFLLSLGGTGVLYCITTDGEILSWEIIGNISNQ